MTSSIGIGQVMIFVSSIDKVRHFYVDLLGLKVQQDLSAQPGMLIMQNPGCILTLHERYSPSVTNEADCRTTVVFAVDDLEAAKARVIEGGVILQGDTHESPIHTYQFVADPDGNWIEIAQYNPSA